jgi:hypothetical protein
MPYLIEQMALNDKERKNLKNFLIEHELYCPQIRRKSLYSIAFCATGGIGIGSEVKCNCCNKTKDITDYGRW